MASANHIYDAIEDELIRALEQGAILPRAFPVNLSEDEFSALLAGGLMTQESGLRIGPTITRVSLSIAGHTLVIRSSKDPDDWDIDQC